MSQDPKKKSHKLPEVTSRWTRENTSSSEPPLSASWVQKFQRGWLAFTRGVEILSCP